MLDNVEFSEQSIPLNSLNIRIQQVIQQKRFQKWLFHVFVDILKWEPLSINKINIDTNNHM